MTSNKKEKRAAFNRGNILDAAQQLFSEKGVTGTSVDDIAKLAEYSKSTVYIYFKSKDDIYYHIVLAYMTLLRDEIKKCLNDNSTIEKCFYAICTSLVEFEKKHPIYFDCILGKISTKQSDFSVLPVLEEIYRVGEQTNDLLEARLKKAQANGEINPNIQPLPAAFVLWSNICGLISLVSNKEDYFKNRLQLEKDAFLQAGFEMIFESIRKQG